MQGFSHPFDVLLMLLACDGTETEESDEEKYGRSYGSLMMERLSGTRDGRIDHMLQVKF